MGGIRCTLRFIAGLFLIVFGIIGLFLPVLQGIVMIIAGIMLISHERGKEIVKRLKLFLKKCKRA